VDVQDGPSGVVVLILLAGASTSFAGAAPKPSRPQDTKTYLFVKGLGRYSATCGPFESYSMMCDADWISPNLDVWTIRLNRHEWGVGAESFTPRHVYYYAKRVRPGFWRVGGQGGSIRLHSGKPTRWDVYEYGEMIGCTSGSQGWESPPCGSTGVT